MNPEEENSEPEFSCPACTAKLSHDMKNPGAMSQIKLTLKSRGNFSCPLCHLEYDSSKVWSEFYRNQKNVLVGLDLVERNELLKSLDVFKISLEYFETHLASPSENVIGISEFYTDAIYKIIRSAESAD